MDHKNSENGSDIIPDLQSNPDETSVKTIHQQNLEKGNRTRVSKTIAYTLLGALSVVLIIVVFALPSFVDKAPEKVSVIEADTSATTTIDLAVLAQKPIANALIAELLLKMDELEFFGIQIWGGDNWARVLLLQQDGDEVTCLSMSFLFNQYFADLICTIFRMCFSFHRLKTEIATLRDR